MPHIDGRLRIAKRYAVPKGMFAKMSQDQTP